MSFRCHARSIFGLVLVLAAAAGPAWAQEPTASPAPRPSPSPAASTAVHRRLGSTFALNAGSPLSVSGSAGLILGRVQTGGDTCPSAVGQLLQVEAGVGGGKVSLG